MDGVSIKIERNYMRKGADNTLASMALIVALSILLVMAMTNPFQDREPNQESTTVPVATSETSGLAAVTICEGELAYFDPVEIHIQTEETPVMAMMEIELPEATAATEPPPYTADDLFCLAAAIYQEAGAYVVSDKARMMVGNVVLNRVKSELYPDTIRGVLEQYGQWGAMWTDGVKFPADAEEEYAEAAEKAYDCARRLLEGERVCPDDVLFAAEFEQGGGIYAICDGIFFCCAR